MRSAQKGHGLHRRILLPFVPRRACPARRRRQCQSRRRASRPRAMRRAPDIRGQRGHPGLQDGRALAGFDLLISTTGDWNSDEALSDLLRGTRIRLPPILCGWLEPHATAAHALLLEASGSCLRCGFTPDGRVTRPVTAWPASKEPEGACAAPYSPYGAVDLGMAQSVVAQLALDRRAIAKRAVSSLPDLILRASSSRQLPDLQGAPSAAGSRSVRTGAVSSTRSTRCTEEAFTTLAIGTRTRRLADTRRNETSRVSLRLSGARDTASGPSCS
jgi:hypothetical protein